MWTHWPEMLPADEMRIAKPKVILTFGVEVFAAVERGERSPDAAERATQHVLAVASHHGR